MSNIKFSYLYRDGGNYKNFGFVILLNSENISLVNLEKLIKANLIDETWFYAHKWNLPELYFDNSYFSIDHTFHEFESVSYTNEPLNINIDLWDFVETIQHHSHSK